MSWNPSNEPVARYVPVGDLSPHPRNYQRHPADQIDRLAASLRTYGQPRPIVVHRGVILAGHGVWQAARLLGWSSIWCSMAPDAWSDTRALAYLIADNETRRGAEPDLPALAEILDETRRDIDIAALGFDEQSLNTLIDMTMPNDMFAQESLAKEDVIPEQWLILVTCASEDEQRKLLDQFISMGVSCRPFIS